MERALPMVDPMIGDSLLGGDRWLVLPGIIALVVVVGGCGGMSDFDAIKKEVADRHRQWGDVTVSNCDAVRTGSDLSGRGPESTYYACDLRGLDKRGFETLFLPPRPPRTVRMCFAVMNDKYRDVLVIGAAHYERPLRY